MELEVIQPRKTEVVVVKNDNKNNPGFFNSVVSAYSNLTNNPFALLLMILAILAILAENNKVDGPFEIIKQNLETFINDTTHTAFLRTIATLTLGLVNLIIQFKNYIFLYMLIFVIAIVYDTNDTFIPLLILTIYITISTHKATTKIFIIQMVFVYYNMTNRFDKLMLFILLVVICFGTENLNTMLNVAF